MFFGLSGVPGFAVAGFAVAGLLPLAGCVAAVDDAVVPELPIGVVAGSAGSDVNGVGSGGKGFERTPATISFMPSVV